MERTSQGLDDGFLDRPEQGRCVCQFSARQSRGMLKLLVIEHPVKGIFLLEFIGPRHIDADIGLIPAEGGPDVPSTFTEGDGRAPMSSQQEMWPAKRAADHVNGANSSVGGMKAFPKRASHRHQVIPQDRYQAVLVSRPVCPASFEDFGGTWQGCIKDRSPSMIETRGMDGYVLAIFYHIHSDLSRTAFFPNPEGSVRNPVHSHIGNLHDGAALIVKSSGVPGEA